ncbi:MAG: methyltransferase domain-containing protein [Pseudomonadota bacterium]
MTVSTEEVQWCYRLLLGREPESAQVVRQREETANRLDLLHSFLDSEEFQKSNPEYRSVHQALNRFEGKPFAVDVQVSPAQLAELLQKVKACWTHLGETQPHWSVMSDEQFRPDHIEASMQRFWASGNAPVKALKRILDRVGFGDLQNKVCVEFGCGMGRMSGPLAALFDKVIGYDISASHLQHARARAGELGIGNLDFQLVADDPLAPLARCDVYYSRIVLQHNPPPLIRQLLANAFAALKPGGIAVFQVSTYLAGYRFEIGEYLGQPEDAQNEFEIHCIPQAAVYQLVAEKRCKLLEVHEDGAAGQPGICVSNLFVVQKPLGPWSRLRQKPAVTNR